MSIPYDDQSISVQEQLQFPIQMREANLRLLCKVAVWVVFSAVFLILETLWFTLPISLEAKPPLIWLTLLAVPALGALTWYCLQLYIGFKVSDMNIQALRGATQSMSTFSSSPAPTQVGEVGQGVVIHPSPVEEMSIPATYTEISEESETGVPAQLRYQFP